MSLCGILPVDKPAGFTSFDVVAKLRGMAKTRKIGHAGTLDPDATGVLPLFLGGATRFIDLLPDHTKRYTATLRLGVVTDTQDLSGTVLETRTVTATEADVRALLPTFVGEQQQLPPMYSAVKKDGVRLYDLARRGQEVERQPRTITIHNLQLLRADEAAGLYLLDVTCSKGAYIRTLCHDMGRALGCGGAMADLRRTEACGYTLADCRSLEELQTLTDADSLAEALLPVESAFSALPRLDLDQKPSALFQNGVRLRLDQLPLLEGERLAVFGDTGEFLGLAKPDFAQKQLIHLRQLRRD